MKARLCIVWLVLMMLPVAAHARKAAVRPSHAARSAPRISVTFERASVEQAVGKVVSLLPDKPSYVIRGELPRSRVTLRLTNVDPGAALRIVCDAAGLTYRVESAPGKRVIVISPTPQTAAAVAQARTWMQWGPRADAAVSRAPVGPRFNGDGRLVDLQVQDARLAEMAAQLARASQYQILVDEAVPKGITVTANVHKMPIGEVLTLLARQAHLAYSVAYLPSPRQVEAAQRAVEDAGGELEAAEQKRKQADVEAQLVTTEAERRVADAQRTVEQAKEDAALTEERAKAGLAAQSESDTKKRVLAGAEDLLHVAQRRLNVDQHMASAGLTVSQIDAAQALSQARRKLEQAQEDARALARGGEAGVIVVPAPDSPPIIYLVPAPELWVTWP